MIALTVILLAGSGAIHLDDAKLYPPKTLFAPSPRTPQQAPGGRIDVRVRLVVDTAGNVSNAEVVESDDPAFGTLVVEKVRTWRYEPLLVDGKPVAWTKTISLGFQGEPRVPFSRSAMSITPAGIEPLAISTPDPVYPPGVSVPSRTELVFVDIEVSAEGLVTGATFRSGRRELEEQALATVRTWVFGQVSVKGTPIAWKARVPVRFRPAM